MSLFGTPSNNQTTTPATGTNIFGNTQQQQNPTGGIFGNTQPVGHQTSLFGNTQPNQPTTSLFGNTNTGATAGGSLFGASNPTNVTQPAGTTGGTNLFGNAPNSGTNTGLFNNTQGGTTPSLFGNTPQPTALGGGIFGNTQNQQQQQPAAGASLFGNMATTTAQPTTGGSLFGNTATNTTQQPATGGSLFGNSSTTTTQPTPNLFGNTPMTNQPTTNLFGNAPTTNQPNTSLFGNTSTTNQPNTSLFGNTSTTNPPTTGLFGNTSNTNTTQPTNLFGNSSTTQQQQSLFGNKPGGLFGPTTTGTTTGTGLFGNTQIQQPQQQPQSNLFGSTNTAQTPSGLFGSTQTNAAGNSLFGNKPQGSLFGSTAGPSNTFNASTLSSSSLPGSRPVLTPVQQQADPQAQALHLQQKIEAIYNAWNPNSPQCRFQYYFYNLVNPNEVGLYARPINARNDALWEKAVRENPDPTCHVPVLAVGFDDLRIRVEAQNKKSDEHQQLLKDIKSRLESLTTHHTLSNSSRLLRAVVAQTQLSQRLLKFVQHLHLLIPSVRSSSIRPEEEHLRTTLEEVEDELKRGRMKGKLNELWALLGAVNAAKERARTGTGEWAVVDEDGLTQLTQILSEQQAGLSHLTKILQKALRDVGIIMGTNTNGAQSDYEVDNLLSSTNNLRASALR